MGLVSRKIAQRSLKTAKYVTGKYGNVRGCKSA